MKIKKEPPFMHGGLHYYANLVHLLNMKCNKVCASQFTSSMEQIRLRHCQFMRSPLQKQGSSY